MNVPASLSAIFFVSGSAALLFEVLWLRQAGLGFGASLLASSLTLTSCIAGFAVGLVLILRYDHRIERPIRLHAQLQAVIALAGLALVLSLAPVGTTLAPILNSFSDTPWTANFLTFACTFLLLLIPSSAFGAALPLLVTTLCRHDARYGSALGRLYGWTALGGAVGVLAGELLLLNALGIRGSAWVAASMSGLACALSLLLSRTLETPPDRTGPSPPEQAEAGRLAKAGRLLGATFLTGFLLLALQATWWRLLLQFVYGTSMALATLLAVVLAAIGLGALGANALRERLPQHTPVASLCAMLAAGAGLALSIEFPSLMERFGTQHITTPSETLFAIVVLCAPVALLSGALLTWIGTALAEATLGETHATAWLTLVAALGAGLGALATGFWLIPEIGVELTLFLLCGTYLIVALLLWSTPPPNSPVRRPIQFCCGIAALCIALLLGTFPFGETEQHLTQMLVKRHGNGPTRVAVARETRTANVLLLNRLRFGEPSDVVLVTNGFARSLNNATARRYMKLFVYWPAAIHPDLRKALLIHYGVGTVARALTSTASLEHIDVVDTTPDILELSSLIHREADPLTDPRVHAHVEDGRYFLRSTTHQYDLITGEPPPPRLASAWRLYTREHFEAIRERLADGGVSTYWLPAHAMTIAATRTVIRAYCDVFPNCSLWNGSGLDWMIVGSKSPTAAVSDSEFVRQWFDQELATEFATLGLERPEQLGAMFIADAPMLDRLTRGVTPLTDNESSAVAHRPPRPEVIERTLARWMNTTAAKKRFEASDYIKTAWPAGWREASLRMFDYQRMLNEVNGRKLPLPRLLEDLYTLQQKSQLRSLALWKLGFTTDDLDILATLEARGAATSMHSELRGARALMHHHFAEAARWYGSARDETPSDPYLSALQAYALVMAKRPRNARDLLSDAAQNPRAKAQIRSVEEWFDRRLPLR